ncbi:LpxA family transferase [Pseudomonas sp. SZMC_28357]|nr:LpxA family transferase [Pseudomonas sp. SZMC_28357]MDR9750891.1 LpxA family transferase [Pseudomonas sp. SZMC_28357]
MTVRIADYIQDLADSPLAQWADLTPWALVVNAPERVSALLAQLSPDEYEVRGDVAVHRTAQVEDGAVLKGPLIIGPGCFIAAGAYLRGGCWLGEGCIIGPGAELKTTFMFGGSKLAHFNFVGDSVLGCGVNLEAGSIIANYRNERADKGVNVRINDQLQATGCDKFGALLGDGVRLGANAVVAPGGLLLPGTVIRRLALYDCEVA